MPHVWQYWPAATALCLVLALVTGCGQAGSQMPTPAQPTPTAGPRLATPLPAPQVRGTLTVEEALAQRRSVREFAAAPLSLAELGQLLWAAQGITELPNARTAPSAGGLYPLEVYAVTVDGVFHYDPHGHRLTMQIAGNVQPALTTAALEQDPVRNAPVVIVIAAVSSRTTAKYGEARGTRYVLLEAGHAAQNILLQAVALQLSAVPIGAFDDERVRTTLALAPDEQPLYLIPVGHLR